MGTGGVQSPPPVTPMPTLLGAMSLTPSALRRFISYRSDNTLSLAFKNHPACIGCSVLDIIIIIIIIIKYESLIDIPRNHY